MNTAEQVNNGTTTVSASEAAVRLRMSRERVIRRIQLGALAGGRNESGWYVERTALEQTDS